MRGPAAATASLADEGGATLVSARNSLQLGKDLLHHAVTLVIRPRFPTFGTEISPEDMKQLDEMARSLQTRMQPERIEANDRVGIGRLCIADPSHILIGPHEYETCLIVLPAVRQRIANDTQRDLSSKCGTFELGNCLHRGIKRQQDERAAQLLKDIPSRRENAWRQMMSGSRLEHVFAARAGHAAGRPEHNR